MKKSYQTISIGTVMSKLPADRRARIETRADEIVAEELALRDLRKSRNLSQTEVAERLGGRQVYVSRLERRSDIKLSTLRSYVEAIGGELQVMVTFPESATVRIKELGSEPPSSKG